MVGVLRETAQDDIVKVMVESAKAKKEEKSQDVRRVNRWHQASVHPTGLHETLFLRFIEEITSGSHQEEFQEQASWCRLCRT